jgi:sugar/nucleoside kinase (ribokinase family)
MRNDPGPHEAPDYLVVGHVTKDLTPSGPVLGGTAVYAGLTAFMLGMRTCVVTSTDPDLNLDPLSELEVISLPSDASTTFENTYEAGKRSQILHAQALPIGLDAIPETWRSSSILHLAPVACEVDPTMVAGCSFTLLGITAQGWMRAWDRRGRVRSCIWNDETSLLQSAGATIISIEDVAGDEGILKDMAQHSRLLVVTTARHGSRVYWRGERRDFTAPEVDEIDSTGSGDIFAACFFFHLHQTGDPWEAARFANRLAAASVTRCGLESVPTAEEIETALRSGKP